MGIIMYAVLSKFVSFGYPAVSAAGRFIKSLIIEFTAI